MQTPSSAVSVWQQSSGPSKGFKKAPKGRKMGPMFFDKLDEPGPIWILEGSPTRGSQQSPSPKNGPYSNANANCRRPQDSARVGPGLASSWAVAARLFLYWIIGQHCVRSGWRRDLTPKPLAGMGQFRQIRVARSDLDGFAESYHQITPRLGGFTIKT